MSLFCNHLQFQLAKDIKHEYQCQQQNSLVPNNAISIRPTDHLGLFLLLVL